MAPSRRLPAWTWDAFGALLVLLTAIAHAPGTEITRSPIGWAVTLVPAALILLRRRAPMLVLIAVSACFGVLIFSDPFLPFASLAVAIAMYTVAVTSDRRTTVITALGLAVVLVVLVWMSTLAALHPASFQIAVTVGFAASFGDAVRTRRAYVAEIVQRAVRAEQTREAEASRRVAEDRLRIARDLHDAVAHQISVISLNAAVASKSVESDPQRAHDALGTIRSASRRVLGDIGTLLSTLRVAEDASGPAPTAGLVLLQTLILEFESAGLEITLRRDGSTEDLPPAIDVIAYRVIQEALTNAHKHGAGARAHVLLTASASELLVIVTNPVHGVTASTGTGHGLAGMRERVESVRGRMSAGRTGDTYRIEVRLPRGGER